MNILYLETLVAIAVSLSVLMAGAWAVQQRTGNSGWVDTIWTFSLGLLALPARYGRLPARRRTRGNGWSRPWWRSGRSGLASHIAVRTAGITDDPRYAAFARNGASILRAGCSCSCRIRALDRSRWCFRFSWRRGFHIPRCGSKTISASPILSVGIAGEALADAQLKRFRIDPANQGRVCDIGLWRWSRHPNYFFEWFGWLAYPVIAISLDAPLFTSGAGDACWRRSSCTGSWCTSPASRRWKRRCCDRAASATATTSRAPACSFHCRRTHDPEK